MNNNLKQITNSIAAILLEAEEEPLVIDKVDIIDDSNLNRTSNNRIATMMVNQNGSKQSTRLIGDDKTTFLLDISLEYDKVEESVTIIGTISSVDIPITILQNIRNTNISPQEDISDSDLNKLLNTKAKVTSEVSIPQYVTDFVISTIRPMYLKMYNTRKYNYITVDLMGDFKYIEGSIQEV